MSQLQKSRTCKGENGSVSYEAGQYAQQPILFSYLSKTNAKTFGSKICTYALIAFQATTFLGGYPKTARLEHAIFAAATEQRMQL